MENNSVRNPTADLSGPLEDPPQMVTPAALTRQPDSLLDDKKTAATLLLSGVFLAVVGVIFTATGWQRYLVNPTFEWTQLLGPILISVGGTFMLTSVCKFGIICLPRGRWDEDVPAMEQTSTGHSFTLSGMNQTVMLHGATTMICIPPAYNFINQEVHQAVEFQPGLSVNGVRAATPPYDSVYCVEGSSSHITDTDCRRSRIERTEDERGREDDSSSACSRPPAYEDIYPSFDKLSPT